MNWTLHKRDFYATLGQGPTCFADTKIHFIETVPFILAEFLLIWWDLSCQSFFLPCPNSSIEEDVDINIYSLSKYMVLLETFKENMLIQRKPLCRINNLPMPLCHWSIIVNVWIQVPAITPMYSLYIVVSESNFSSCSVVPVGVMSVKLCEASD